MTQISNFTLGVLLENLALFIVFLCIASVVIQHMRKQIVLGVFWHIAFVIGLVITFTLILDPYPRIFDEAQTAYKLFIAVIAVGLCNKISKEGGF